MGDEFHQRNIAASLCFLKEMAPIITDMDMPEDEKSQVIKFLSDTESVLPQYNDGYRKVNHGWS